MFKTFEERRELSPAEELLQRSKTLDFQLSEQLRDKYKTFNGFNFRQAYVEARQRTRRKAEQAKQSEMDIGLALQMFIKNSLLPDAAAQKAEKKKLEPLEELVGIKTERRERFQKTGNTFQLIKHYIERQGFKPSEEETYLMTQLAQIKEYADHSSLENLLRKIYRIMNQAVDLNELRFLCLLVVLAADIAMHFKQYTRAFYFYNQARIFASYAELYQVKIEALTQLGVIAVENRAYTEAKRLYKKALQYAWKTKSVQNELLLYDLIGNVYYYEGCMRESNYYHRRFAQGECEHTDSAIKRLSSEMLAEYCSRLKSLERTHLTSLFLQYIQIPIVNHSTLPPPLVPRPSYQNYDEQGHSPRKSKHSQLYEQKEFPPVLRQLADLQGDPEFLTQIPNPDVQRTFVACHRFGRPRKEQPFEQSPEYHKLAGASARERRGKLEDVGQVEMSTFEKRLEKALAAKAKQDWWGAIKDRIRKGKAQKIGAMKDRIYNSHQSYAKYPEERRRAQSLRGEKIKQSFNKTLLDWIDPPK